MKTAAIIIIGNEILSGRITDTNSQYLCKELRLLGVDVRRVSVIPDDLDAIASEVAALSKAHDFVFTSGGIGPTHDDVTVEGVARAFGRNTVRNERIVALMRQRCEGEVSELSLKMAELPEGAEIIEVGGMSFPPIAVRNVYIFPGIPSLLKRKFQALRDRFRCDRPFLIRRLHLDTEECIIAGHLHQVESTHPGVSVGSYPGVNEGDARVVVTLEGTDEAQLDTAFRELMALIPREAITAHD